MIHAKKSAIVGYWRCGVKFDKIAELLNMDVRDIYEIVGHYINTGKHE